MSSSAHIWGPPIAGQGNVRVCKLCGCKELPTVKDMTHPDSACGGVPQTYVAQVSAEYDPYN